MKISELTGAALDWAVAKAEGDELTCKSIQYPEYAKNYPKFSPSTDWVQGGPIIEREKLGVGHDHEYGWTAVDNNASYYHGATPLEAAMRCYVASKLGDEVELPEELQWKHYAQH